MATVDLLKDLNNKIDTCKSDLSATLNEKGVSSSTGDTLTLMVDKVKRIQTLLWDKIGYTVALDSLIKGYDEAVKIYENWDMFADNLDYRFANNLDLIFLPDVTFQNVTNMSHCFQGCYRLCEIPQLETENVKSLFMAFQGCSALKKINLESTANCTNFCGTFSSCHSLIEEPRLLWLHKAATTASMFHFCDNLVKIEQPLNCDQAIDTSSMFLYCEKLQLIKEIDLKSSEKIEHMFLGCRKLRYLYIKNLGAAKNASNNSLLLKHTKWGVDGDGIIGAKQSMLDTFNNAFDRASAGYPTLTVVISEETNAVITPEEKSAFESKGYLLEVA